MAYGENSIIQLGILAVVSSMMLILMGFIPIPVHQPDVVVVDKESWNFTQMNQTISMLEANNTALQNQTAQLQSDLKTSQDNNRNYWFNFNWFVSCMMFLLGSLLHMVWRIYQDHKKEQRDKQYAEAEANAKKAKDEAIAVAKAEVERELIAKQKAERKARREASALARKEVRQKIVAKAKKLTRSRA